MAIKWLLLLLLLLECCVVYKADSQMQEFAVVGEIHKFCESCGDCKKITALTMHC